jgi:hypothetical protein
MTFKVCRRTGKIGYRSVGEARAALVQIELNESIKRTYQHRPPERTAYRCRYCPRWHLTSQRPWGGEAVDLYADPS